MHTNDTLLSSDLARLAAQAILKGLGRAALRDGHFRESLALRHRMGARRGLAETIERFGALAAHG